jgi:hypothetical protein
MNKRDLSISMTRANVLVILLAIPLVIVQFGLFLIFNPQADLMLTLNLLVFLLVFALSIVVHELIHGVTWVLATRRPWSAVKFGFQWKTLTPYAHIKEPTEVNAYRIGAFMPGFILGILPFILSLITGNSNLLWFSLLNTTAAGGDWLILWMIRNVKAGTLVEDHPTNAGCYVLEGQ